MKKRIVSVLLLTAIVTAGCAKNDVKPLTPTDEPTQEASVGNDNASKEATTASETAAMNPGRNATLINASFLGDAEDVYYDKNLVPSVAPYSVAADFSNVVYDKEFAYLFDLTQQSEYNNVKARRDALIKNSFFLEGTKMSEFFDVYEDNSYVMFPNFVTVDSLMHTYHLYFAHLMKTTEKEYLAADLQSLTETMLSAAEAQSKVFEGTEWETSARRNLAFFAVAQMLDKDSSDITLEDSEVLDAAKQEYDKIMAAQGIDDCILTGLMEDYSQYKPRGYYDESDDLKRYFRTMMWYGRIPFALDNAEGVRSAVLMCAALSEDPSKYGNIYSVTAFFAGNSDDPGYNELIPIIDKAYGKIPSDQELADNEDAFDVVLEEVKNLPLPQINSIPVMEGDDPVIPSFRFMGQRFTIDAAIMQRLIYEAVKENPQGERRMLPDPLDVAAALGSEAAYKILEEKGACEFENYTGNLILAKEHFDNDDPELWNASLYSGWMNILRPLFEEKGEGYPSYMQSEEWTKKNLETYCGSYAELKHDTILYAKQNMAEMGGGDMEILDDRGYVDPQPVIYSRFVSLANKTRDGLSSMGLLGDKQKEDLDKLSEIGMMLLKISEKELKNETCSEEEYEFIRCYGGYIEHFWQEANLDKFQNGDDANLVSSYQFPCPVVADIATDPNGTVLEIGSGEADTVYVVFPIDGELHVARGSAYSFYQFEVPISERMTDEEFQEKLDGGHFDENWNWVVDEDIPQRADWTDSYRLNN
ncbi:DUF3160 domain-containing protein [Butyrivibrio sp. MC2021]|uniref:DUF3160 domain-containing protein n=1 Tax=Butyrivibrio sp. MC2021 TaxID=1408306 RepID=UPI00068680C0|nr:DUF3160 domain-containing protein [Butyrivibrio sp. MC2021]